MEFHVSVAQAHPRFDSIKQALLEVDPSVVADVDANGTLMRIATSLDAVQLIAILQGAGMPVHLDAVRQLPSICCGGCSG